MEHQQANAFPDPLSIPTPEGCEGWEEMYPYYVLFSEDRAEYERSKFWFQNRYHLMDPMKPFDMVTPEFCYIAIANRNNRILQLPPATGVDFRVVNGYGYLAGNPVLDGERIAARAVTFGQRAGHYFENWAEIEKDWQERTNAEIAKLEALQLPDLPELEDMSVVTNHQAHGAGFEMHQFFNRLMEAKHLAWHFHMEMILIGFGAYNTFFEFCQKAFPEIDKQSIANMITGLGGTPFDRADDELKRLARVAVELNLDAVFGGDGSAEEAFARLADSDAGRQWLAEYDKSKYPWFMVNTGDGMYSHHRAWIDDPRMIVTGVHGYITRATGGQGPVAAAGPARRGRPDRAGIPGPARVGRRPQGLRRHARPGAAGLRAHRRAQVLYRALVARAVLQQGPRPEPDLRQVRVLERHRGHLLSTPDRGPRGAHRHAAGLGRRLARSRTEVLATEDPAPPGDPGAAQGLDAAPALGPVPEVVGDPVLSMLWGIDGNTLREWARPVDADTTQLRGTPASSGVVEGVARVVHGIDQMDTVQQGEILVAPTTNPSWTPVFSRISACVADGGGMMSHAAIVCREHGVPAIVGTGRATRAIKTGQRIRVDGNTGIVTILD